MNRYITMRDLILFTIGLPIGVAIGTLAYLAVAR